MILNLCFNSNSFIHSFVLVFVRRFLFSISDNEAVMEFMQVEG